MKVRAPNIHPFAANGHFSLYYRPFFSLSSYHILESLAHAWEDSKANRVLTSAEFWEAMQNDDASNDQP